MKKNLQALQNVFGNVIYLAAQWWMTIIVAKMSTGYADAGTLALAITVTNIIYLIASYGMRSFQVSDVNNVYSHKEYVVSRYATIIASLIILVVYLQAGGYSFDTNRVILLYMLYKVSEAYSDVCYGIQQRKDNFNVICLSLCMKGMVNVVCFSISYAITKSLNVSILYVVVGCCLINLLYDRRRIIEYEDVKYSKWSANNIFKLLKETAPLMITLMLPQILVAIPRLIFEKKYSRELLGIYSSISTPTALITTFVSCAIMPFIPLMAEYYYEGEERKQIGIQVKCIMICLGLGLAAMVCSILCGDMVLTLLYGEKVTAFMNVFYLIIISTVLSAIIMCLNSVYIAMRKVGHLVSCLAVGTSVCACISYKMVEKYAMSGVAYAMIVSQIVEIVLLWVFFMRLIRANKEMC